MRILSPPLNPLIALLAAASLVVAVAAAADDAVVETTAGERATGSLASIDDETIRLDTPSGPRTFTVGQTRTVTRTKTDKAEGPTVRLICVDGGRLSGTGFTADGELVTLAGPEGAATLPIARVRTVLWNHGGEPEADGDRPAWLATLPEPADADIVVVAKGGDVQFVPCAIVGVTPEKVTVILDGETIPVNRDKVVGLHWLREPAPAGGIAVGVEGGSLHASNVAWGPGGLVIDGVVRLPATALRSIDYAAARTVRLATLPTERLDVEPFFGGLREIEGMSDYFRPRVVGIDAAPARDLVMRARTVAVWRVPEGSRSFSTAVSPVAISGGAVVAIALDEREVFRGAVDQSSLDQAGRLAIAAIPVGAARRLSITVDYGTAGPIGGAVVFHDPLFTR